MQRLTLVEVIALRLRARVARVLDRTCSERCSTIHHSKAACLLSKFIPGPHKMAQACTVRSSSLQFFFMKGLTEVQSLPQVVTMERGISKELCFLRLALENSCPIGSRVSRNGNLRSRGPPSQPYVRREIVSSLAIGPNVASESFGQPSRSFGGPEAICKAEAGKSGVVPSPEPSWSLQAWAVKSPRFTNVCGNCAQI